MSNIRFRSAAHRDFFLEMMSKSKVNDCYHRALSQEGSSFCASRSALL